MIGLASLAATVLLVFCGATLSAMVAGAVSGEWAAVEAFAVLSVAYALAGGFTLLAIAGVPKRIDRHQAFAGAIIMWITLVAAAVPGFIFVEHLDPIVAFYEATSAAVTMGDSLIPVSTMGSAMIVYRSVTAWLGGLLTLMLAIYVLGRYSVGGTPNRDLRYVLHGFSRGDPRFSQTFIEVFVPYLAITLLCAVALVMARVEPAQALVFALNILSTNGFVGWQTGGSILNNQIAETIVMLFMVLGASSIILLRAILGRRARHTQDQKENLIFAAAIVFTLALVSASSYFSTPTSSQWWSEVFGQAFDIVSIITTTGFTHDLRQGIGIPIELSIGLALMGGCAYSTAGGVKMFRLNAMLHHSANEVKRLVYPNQVLPRSIDTDQQMIVSAKAIWSAFFIALIFIVGTMVSFAALGHSFLSSLALAVGAFSNVGNLVGTNLFQPENSSVPILSLVLVSISGIAGRVELLVVLAAFSRSRWT